MAQEYGEQGAATQAPGTFQPPWVGDEAIASFINDVAPFVPPAVQRELWGYANRMIGLAKFDPRKSSAMIDRINAVAILVKMSVPKRKVTPNFIIDLENFITFAKVNVWRATLPRNERELLAGQVTASYGYSGDGARRRKKFLGLI